jgi:hypothetical protein
MADKDHSVTPVGKPPGKVPDPSSSGEIADFVRKVGQIARPAGAKGQGRLLFALDATMSRQPTWDLACTLQGEMFKALPHDGSLAVQLLYFRGLAECRASKWVGDAAGLGRIMSGVACQGGNTQISKVFAHARREHATRPIDALVYVGDAIEENVDSLAAKAGELGLLGCKMFVFQEGRDPRVEAAFREFARLTKGAYARFDTNAPAELAALLRAVAAYATGGRAALKLQNSARATALLEQLS